MDKPFFDPSQVNDVETARLALRWSLEKIHGLQSDLNTSQETAKDAVDKLRQTTEKLTQKDAALLRWQSTIKTWEANWKDHQQMEDEIRARLEKEIVREEDVRGKEARLQLQLHIETLKKEIASRESTIGDLRRELIDTAKNVRVESEKETQDLLAHQERALEETKESLLERLQIQQDLINKKEAALEDQQRILDEKILAKEADIRQKYERNETELAKRTQATLDHEMRALDNQFQAKLTRQEEILNQKEQQMDLRRQRLEEEHAKRMEQIESTHHIKYEKEWESLQQRLDSERKLLEDNYQQKEKALDESLLARNDDVQGQLQKTEEELTAKYQALQNQLIRKDKELGVSRQTHFEETITQNREALDTQREELETSFEAKEQELFEKHKNLESAFEKKEAEFFGLQQNRLDEMREKEEELVKKYHHLQSIAAEKSKKDWEEQTAKLNDNIDEYRGKIDAERKEMEQSHRIKEEALFKTQQASERERSELKKTYDERLRAQSNQLQEQLQAEHDKAIEAKDNKRETHFEKFRQNLTHDLARKEAALRSTIQAEQSQWLKQQDESVASLRKDLIEKNLKTAADLKTKYEERLETADSQMNAKLTDERRELNLAFKNLEKELNVRHEERRNAMVEELRKSEAETLSASRQSLEEEKTKLQEEKTALHHHNQTVQSKLKSSFDEKEKSLRDEFFSREASVKAEIDKKENFYRTTYQEAAKKDSAEAQRSIALIESQLRDQFAAKERALQEARVKHEQDWVLERGKILNEERQRLENSYKQKETTLDDMGNDLKEKHETQMREIEAELQAKTQRLEEAARQQEREAESARMKLALSNRNRESQLQETFRQKEEQLQRTLDERKTALSKIESEYQARSIEREAELQGELTARQTTWLKAQRADKDKDRRDWEDTREREWEERRRELEITYQQKFNKLEESLHKRQQETEGMLTQKEKDLIVTYENQLFKARTEMEASFRSREEALELKYLESEKRSATERVSRETAWNMQKQEVVERELAGLRREFEEKQATVTVTQDDLEKKFDERRKALENTHDKQTRELESAVAQERDSVRAFHEKRSKELEEAYTEKFSELEKDKNRLAINLQQKEDELHEQFQKNESERRKAWAIKQLELSQLHKDKQRKMTEERDSNQKDYERRVRELELRIKRDRPHTED